MEKGIQFKIDNEYNNFLGKILKNINYENYQWNIDDSEIYDNKGYFYFQKSSYDNNEFKLLIENGNYYLVFANIQLYEYKNKKSKISNYNDFINSDCKLILFVTDNSFVDIYAKDNELLDIIYKNAKDNNFSNIKLINNIDEVRHKFSAYYD